MKKAEALDCAAFSRTWNPVRLIVDEIQKLLVAPGTLFLPGSVLGVMLLDTALIECEI